MLPVLSVLLDVTVIQKRRKYPGRTYSILAGHAGGDFADGGVLIQYNVMRHRSTALRGRGEVKKSSPHEVKDLLGFFFPSSFVLLRGLWRRALGLAILGGGGFAAPRGVVAQSWGTIKVVFVIQAVGGIVLCVLQTGDQTLILVPKLAAHQGRLAYHHHVLKKEREEERKVYDIFYSENRKTHNLSFFPPGFSKGNNIFKLSRQLGHFISHFLIACFLSRPEYSHYHTMGSLLYISRGAFWLDHCKICSLSSGSLNRFITEIRDTCIQI